MKDPIVLSNAARNAALESLGVTLGNDVAPGAISSNNVGAHGLPSTTPNWPPARLSFPAIQS